MSAFPDRLATMGKSKKRAQKDDAESDNEEDEYMIRRHGNRVYFFSEVTPDSILVLFKLLDEAKDHCIKNGIENIYLHVQSEGGCVFSGLNAMEHVSRLHSQIPVIGVACGCAASAATLILMGTSYIEMYEYSFILIHQLSTAINFARFNEMKDEMNNNEKINNTLKNVYRKYTDLTDDKLNELFTKEVYLSSAECLEYGIVDQVL